jgi:hypothetical protein
MGKQKFVLQERTIARKSLHKTTEPQNKQQ